MTHVGIRELKSRLSEYLRLAAAGELVLVTDRGRVVAELRAPGSATAAGSALLAEAASRGLVRLPHGPPQSGLYDLSDLEPLDLPQGLVGDLLDELRGDRGP